MRQCKTGAHRIRSAMPTGWVVGDKTGTGYYGSAGDIAIIWPLKSPPILISIYISKDTKHANTSDEVFASAAKIVMGSFLKS